MCSTATVGRAEARHRERRAWSRGEQGGDGAFEALRPDSVGQTAQAGNRSQGVDVPVVALLQADVATQARPEPAERAADVDVLAHGESYDSQAPNHQRARFGEVEQQEVGAGVTDCREGRLDWLVWSVGKHSERIAT
jgi:hypothetical protein